MIGRIKKLAEPIILQYNLELISVKETNEFNEKTIQIIIDDPTNINIDVNLVGEVNLKILDEINDLLPDDYFLEVSSLGAERELIRPIDFERALNKYIYIKVNKKIEGTKGITEFYGFLRDYNDLQIVIEANLKGRIKKLPILKEDILIIRQAIKF